jgi:hypothetical protein
MVVALLLFFVGALSAQTDDGQALLREVASSARSAKNWRAEGVSISELTGRGMHLHAESHFKLAVQGPSKMFWRPLKNW